MQKANSTGRTFCLRRRFVEYRAAQGIGKARQVKYIGTLRLIAERYLEEKDYVGLTREELIRIVAKHPKVMKKFQQYLNGD
ncbi:MAG: hypothetical protein KAU16_07595 [Methanophagales archaeon]|nr:hypothetical protein [Methanophagales archaeon]